MVKGVNGSAEESIYTYNGLGALMENTWIIAKNGYGYHDVTDEVAEPEDPTPEVPDPGETTDPEEPGETTDPETPDPGETTEPEEPDTGKNNNGNGNDNKDHPTDSKDREDELQIRSKTHHVAGFGKCRILVFRHWEK